MKLGPGISLVLLLAGPAWPSVAADHYWNCTRPDGTKYADASACDKGDTGAKVLKGNSAPLSDAKPNSLEFAVCPTNPANCLQPDYGVTQGSPRVQAIAQFLRKKQCAFLDRFPEHCQPPR